MILEAKKIKSLTVSIVSPSICHKLWSYKIPLCFLSPGNNMGEFFTQYEGRSEFRGKWGQLGLEISSVAPSVYWQQARLVVHCRTGVELLTQKKMLPLCGIPLWCTECFGLRVGKIPTCLGKSIYRRGRQSTRQTRRSVMMRAFMSSLELEQATSGSTKSKEHLMIFP